MTPAEDNIEDDGSAFSENSEFEEGSSYSVSIFLFCFGIQLGPIQAGDTHPTKNKKVIMRMLNCQGLNFV
jgi:hypothetical protein